MKVYSEIDSVFEQDITIYRGADFVKDFYYEDRSVEIISFTPGSTTEITTQKPHFLSNGEGVNIRGVEGSEEINNSLTVTIVNGNSFRVPVATNGRTLSGGTANRPVNLAGWIFGAEVRSAIESNAGDSGGVVASISTGDLSSVILDGQNNLVVGDEITITAAGITNAKILSLTPTTIPSQLIARIDSVASGGVVKVPISRNTKLIATFNCFPINALAGKFRITLPAIATAAMPSPAMGGNYYYDVKYKSGNFVFPIVRGRAIIESLATQLTL